MITLKQLADNIQTKLNNAGDFVFYIVPDTGKFKKAMRTGNTVINHVNGVMSVVNSETTTLVGGSIYATMICRLSFIVKLENPDETFANTHLLNSEYTVEELRNVIDGAFQKNDAESMQEDVQDNPKTFVVMSQFEFAQSGDREQSQIIGNSYRFNANLYYVFVENGMSNYSINYYIDGLYIPFRAKTTTRVITMDGNVYANTTDGAVKNIGLQSLFSLAIDLPALKDEVTARFFGFLYESKINQAHILCITYPVFSGIGYENKIYLVSFSELTESGEGVQNIGLRLTILEAPEDYELVNFGDGLHGYYVSVNASGVYFSALSDYCVYQNSQLIRTGRIAKDTDLNLDNGAYAIVSTATAYIAAQSTGSITEIF